MVGELDGLLLDDYKKYRAKADKAKENKDYLEAAEYYKKAASTMTKLVNKTDNKKLKEQRKALAEKLSKLASDLEQGKIPVKKIPRQRSGQAVATTEAETEEDFEGFVETLISKSTIGWEDIGGLDETKSLIRETIVIGAVQRPDAIKPWKGILLFGPPGTGKTMIAAATAGSLEATFFNVTVGQMLSKYYGESSKIVGALYNLSRKRSPSIVFLDEFDSIALSRGADIDEASRRTLSTLLSELDGFKDKGSDLFLLTIAATNTPWDLDPAVMSRFPKRIYLPLPDAKACAEIIKIHTVKGGVNVEGLSFEELGKRCVEKRYSGRDIKSLCTEALWKMVKSENPDLDKLAQKSLEEMKQYKLKTSVLRKQDFDKAFSDVKSSISVHDLEKYKKWAEEMGKV